VLEDPRRHLVAQPQPRTRIGTAISTLQEVMDDLTHTLQATTRRRAA
jgi:hypothetical protein